MGILCDVNLDNPQLVYQPGDVVSGHIMLNLEERTLIKALALKISGYAATHWEKPIKEKKKNKDQTETETPKQIYTNREDYISTIHYFVGSEIANAKVIESGAYHYSFAVTLPMSCPSVFESTFGHIRYELDVFMEYPDYRHSCYFRNIHVSCPYDLSGLKGAAQPNEISIEEKKRLVKFWKRPLQLNVDVPKIGYVPGEMLSVHVKILNYDLINLTQIVYKLNLVATYTGFLKNKAKMHIARNNLATKIHSLFGQNGNIVQHLQNIFIPETPPTLSIANCRCIQISYEIEIAVSSTLKNRNISAFMPIVIGTVLQNRDHVQLPQGLTGSGPVLSAARSMDNLAIGHVEESFQFAGATAPTEPTAPCMEEVPSSAPTVTVQAVPSTSFREADFMPASTFSRKKKQCKSTENLDNFKPKYLYYNIPNEEQPNGAVQPADQEATCGVVVNNERRDFREI